MVSFTEWGPASHSFLTQRALKPGDATPNLCCLKCRPSNTTKGSRLAAPSFDGTRFAHFLSGWAQQKPPNFLCTTKLVQSQHELRFFSAEHPALADALWAPTGAPGAALEAALPHLRQQPQLSAPAAGSARSAGRSGRAGKRVGGGARNHRVAWRRNVG